MEKHLKAFGVTENDCIKTYIIKTSDYSKLKPFSGNRYGGFESQLEYTTQSEIDKFNKHVNEIKKSMIEFGKERGESCGLFDPREPIIVFEINGEYYIGDGQHRAAAAKWERLALNSPTQGTGSAIIKYASILFFNWIKKNKLFNKVFPKSILKLPLLKIFPFILT